MHIKVAKLARVDMERLPGQEQRTLQVALARWRRCGPPLGEEVPAGPYLLTSVEHLRVLWRPLPASDGIVIARVVTQADLASAALAAAGASRQAPNRLFRWFSALLGPLVAIALAKRWI